MIEEFSLQNVANLLWAAVQLDYKFSPRMLSRLVAAALRNMEGANPITIAGLLMSYTKMEDVSGSEQLFLACLQEVCGLPGSSRTYLIKNHTLWFNTEALCTILQYSTARETFASVPLHLWKSPGYASCEIDSQTALL